ncbi:TIGR04282 family arsenosugar biosynthesis glycosyltransferase [Marimonas arenosa]|uniref:Glycosyltransferase n=1 Tax=Marimonas arenosa TaxID=1795305 RepID=A0AAE4B526_9RHOB|nr:TIGR04282 family arsenosugar biosynthesis glycosyltransferase [Marimonas arenosa]MDQ2090712.1 glycosyltransferase [Marimonas arenosa]
MVKAPVAGRVKTRLAHDIGTIPATWWFRHQVARLVREVTDPRWDTILAVSPDTDLRAPFWPALLPRVPQGAGDLGQRMARLLRLPHPGPVCLIGGDLPGLKAAHIARAVRLCRGHDAVFGPASDGGFWLVGLRHPSLARAGLFNSVRWSTPHALADSLASLDRRRVALADTLADVDRAADL